MPANQIRRGLAVLALAATLPAQGQGAAPDGERRAVPSPDALAAARAAALALLTDELVHAGGDDITAAQQRLAGLAAHAPDDATRWLLLEQSVQLAERAHLPARACAALQDLARAFAIDHEAALIELLRRMAQDRACASAIALLALEQAQRRALAVEGTPARLHEVALAAAAGGDDAWLRAAVADEAAQQLQLHADLLRWCGAGLAPAARTARARLLADLCLDPERLLPTPLREFAGLLPSLADQTADLSLAGLGAERLLTLSHRVEAKWLRRSLQRLARESLARRLREAGDDAERSVLARQLASVIAALADRDGVTRLRFASAEALRQLAVAPDTWSIADGLLVGVARKPDTYATHRCAFAEIRSVVIRGGIRSAAGLNFRLAVGGVNVIFNWEVQPQNHLWSGGVQQTTSPPALTPGQEHTIALHAVGGEVLVLVDERLWFTARGALAGTVCVYPALGSEIFVREILVDGELECSGPVAGPRGELK